MNDVIVKQKPGVVCWSDSRDLDQIKILLVQAGARVKSGPNSQIPKAITSAVKFAAAHGWTFAPVVMPAVERRGMPAVEYAEMVADYEAAALQAAEQASQPGGAG